MPARLKVKALFTPPHFADVEKTRVAGLLFTLELVFIVTVTVAILIAVLFGRIQLASILVIALLITMVGIWLTRRGYVNLAAMIITSMMIVSIIYTAYTNEGIHAHALLGFVLVIVIRSSECLACLKYPSRYFQQSSGSAFIMPSSGGTGTAASRKNSDPSFSPCCFLLCQRDCC